MLNTKSVLNLNEIYQSCCRFNLLKLQVWLVQVWASSPETTQITLWDIRAPSCPLPNLRTMTCTKETALTFPEMVCNWNLTSTTISFHQKHTNLDVDLVLPLFQVWQTAAGCHLSQPTIQASTSDTNLTDWELIGMMGQNYWGDCSSQQDKQRVGNVLNLHIPWTNAEVINSSFREDATFTKHLLDDVDLYGDWSLFFSIINAETSGECELTVTEGIETSHTESFGAALEQTWSVGTGVMVKLNILLAYCMILLLSFGLHYIFAKHVFDAVHTGHVFNRDQSDLVSGGHQWNHMDWVPHNLWEISHWVWRRYFSLNKTKTLTEPNQRTQMCSLEI